MQILGVISFIKLQNDTYQLTGEFFFFCFSYVQCLEKEMNCCLSVFL